MHEAIAAALEVSVVGITIVFASLTLLSLTLALINRLPWSRSTAEPAVGTGEPSVPPEVVVVLAAAATAALGRPVRVAHVRYHAAVPDPEWAHHGRISIMGSHRVRR